MSLPEAVVTALLHIYYKSRGTCVDSAELNCLDDSLNIEKMGPSSLRIFVKMT